MSDGILSHLDKPTTTAIADDARGFLHGRLDSLLPGQDTERLATRAERKAFEFTHTKPDDSFDPDRYAADVRSIDAIRSSLGKEQFIGYLRGRILELNWFFGKEQATMLDGQDISVYAGWLEDAIAERPLRAV